MGSKMVKHKTKTHKHIDHNPSTESTKAVFGEPKAKDDEFVPHRFT